MNDDQSEENIPRVQVSDHISVFYEFQDHSVQIAINSSPGITLSEDLGAMIYSEQSLSPVDQVIDFASKLQRWIEHDYDMSPRNG